MKIIASAHHILLIIFFFLIFINVRAQIPGVAPIKFHQVDEKRFYEIKDSLYAKPGDGFRYDNDVYLTLTASELYEIIKSLKNGFIPYLDRKPYIQTTEILYSISASYYKVSDELFAISR